MPRVALDGISLAVNEWPGPTDKSVVCIQNPGVKSALRAFLAAR